MRWVWRGLLTLLLLAAVAVIALFVVGRMSLPLTDGEVRLAGLTGEVQVIRDRFAVPHIFAENRPDAIFALGYAHAQDRLWQMELQRRIGAGRLSEFGGESTVDTDIFLRTLGVYRAAEATVANLDPETRGLLDAYAAGVNAYLASHEGLLPPEFLVLGIKPEPWRPADTLVWLKMMAWNLSGNWRTEALRARLSTVLSARQMRDLWPDYPADGPVALGDVARAIPAGEWTRLVAADPMPKLPGMGSNNWVIAGSRSATGKPLLANDPHLGLQSPSLWYLAQIDDGTHTSIGATLPGVPFVVLGRNRNVAWGFTNTETDVQDLYVEKVNPENPDEYLTPAGWDRFSTREEVIRIKGLPPRIITVRGTRHGPVMSDATGGLAAPAGHVIALRWHVLDDDEMSVRAGLNVHRVRNGYEFREAMRDFDGAQQNMVYADGQGTIGMISAGRVPIRGVGGHDQGMMPLPGWDAAYDRVGEVAYEDLPQTVNPAAGMVVTANNRIVGDDYPWFLTNEWSAPYRAQRITDLLGARTVHSLESFKSIQADQVSLLARRILPAMLAIAPATKRASAVVADLRLWDGTMSADAIEPTLFNAWYREFVRQVLIDETGDAFDALFSQRPLFIINVLENVDGAARWCDDVATAEVESCRVILVRALELALADLETRYGEDRSAWRWGDVHRAKSNHNPFTYVPVLRDLFDLSTPVGGDSFTVNVSRNAIGDETDPFATTHAASLRAIYDLDDPNGSLFMHSTGQSGHVLSPHYDDFVERWRQVSYIPLSMRRSDVEAGAIGVLRLVPAP
ncbi:MAG: penicillin acylase family protein [Pseudomonadota bacterium]|nr:penicillin acylase family protein [Pseudomonadota bacterium]